MAIRLRASGEEDDGQEGKKRRKDHRRVYFEQDHLERKNTNPGLDKEAIQIPNPPPRRISKVEQILANIMSPRSRDQKMHGLVGKPLL